MSIINDIKEITASEILIYVTAFALIIQSTILIISYIADHRRRRRQATFEFYHNIYERFIEQLKRINEVFPEENKPIKVSEAKDKKDVSSEIRGYLSCMERFAVGINRGIYDFDIFKSTVGAIHTIKLFYRFNEFISDFREKNNCSFAYKALEDLVSNLKQAQQNICRNCGGQKKDCSPKNVKPMASKIRK